MGHALRSFAGLMLILTALRAGAGETTAAGSQIIKYGRFGDVTVYRPSGEPRDVVLFLSGGGGWEPGVAEMAQRLAGKGALVAGINSRRYMAEMENASEKCISTPVDFENFSHYLQSKAGIAHYLQPTLAGYSSGATLAYATLIAAPEGLFKGSLSIGFCPGLDLKKPICKGSGIEFTPRKNAKGGITGVNFLPAKKLGGRWISVQGPSDELCPAEAATEFIAKVPGAESVALPKPDRRLQVGGNWMNQFETAFERIVASGPKGKPASLPAALADLPLTEVAASPGAYKQWFGVFLSGDGGWVGLDPGVAAELARRGIPVVGWDSLRYFWSPRTPQGAARDLERVLRHYSRVWGKPKALLVGYSQGADTLPFMVNRLSKDTRDLVGMTALVGVSESAFFEFHASHWLGNPDGGLPIQPELAQWSGAPYLCLYGAGEEETVCPKLESLSGRSVRMAGGHRFGGSYAEVADRMLRHLASY
jgi:type IV secretory pathway VirJ component